MDANQALLALSALAQEHRLSAFRLLVEAGPTGLPAGQIAAALNMPASSLSFHLSLLAEAGLVRQQREGRSLIYSAQFATMEALVRFLTDNCCSGAECLPALADLECGE